MVRFKHETSIQRVARFVSETLNISYSNDATILKHIERIPGINTPMLHIGGPFTYFAFQVEYEDLPRAPYLFSRAPKVWYVVLHYRVTSSRFHFIKGIKPKSREWVR